MNDDERTTEASNGRPAVVHAQTSQYEIRVRGQLGQRWATWFDGMALTNAGDGTTVISGPVVDQAALHGLLQKLRDLGLELVSLTGGTDITPGTGVTVQGLNPNTTPGAPS